MDTFQIAFVGYIICSCYILFTALLKIKFFETLGERKDRSPEKQKAWNRAMRNRKITAWVVAFIPITPVVLIAYAAVLWFKRNFYIHTPWEVSTE